MNCIIIEDERRAALRMKNMITAYAPEFAQIEIFNSVADSIKYLKGSPPPDIMIMDIELSDGLSFNIISETEIFAPIIFTTAHEQYYERAMQYGAIDFLLKPVKKASLINALLKLKRLHQRVLTVDNQNEKKLFIKYGQKYYITPLSKIAFIYSAQGITIIVRKDGLRLPLKVSLSQLHEVRGHSRFQLISPTLIAFLDDEVCENLSGYSTKDIQKEILPQLDIDSINKLVSVVATRQNLSTIKNQML